jgi:hypothetical protein
MIKCCRPDSSENPFFFTEIEAYEMNSETTDVDEELVCFAKIKI